MLRVLINDPRLEALSAPLYRRFWMGSVASVGATQLVFMGQGWLVFELSGSALDLAILGAASSVPAIAVTFLGGVTADRVDRRLLMLCTTPVLALLLAVQALVDAHDTVTVWQVWLIAGLFAAVSGFDWPARQAIFTSLIDRSQMMSAVALNSMLWQGTRMVMPALGGVIVAATSTAAVFALCTTGFLIMLWVLLGLRTGAMRTARVGSWQGMIEGVRFVAHNRLFAVLIPLTYVTTFFGTSYLSIMPLFAGRLGQGAGGYGMLISASGVGSIVGTLLVGSLQRSARLGSIMLGCALGAAVIQLLFTALTGWAPREPWSFATAVVLVLLVAALSSGYLITSMTALQLFVPDALRGRVMSLHAITFSLIALGALFSGSIASVLGAPAAVAMGAGIVVLAVLGVWMTQPAVRELRNP